MHSPDVPSSWNSNSANAHRNGILLQGEHDKTLLFVDDEPGVLTVRRLLFEALGYHVLTASSGRDALQVIRTNQVDAVILDYLMPVMNGEETARAMRQENFEGPIVLSSGCLSLPGSLLEVVDVSVEKGTGPEVLIAVLKGFFHPTA